MIADENCYVFADCALDQAALVTGKRAKLLVVFGTSPARGAVAVVAYHACYDAVCLF
jgi:hypothetical protein